MPNLVKRSLTPKQKKILDFILNFTEKKDFAPSLKEIADNIGLKAVSTVYQHIKALEKKGYLKKENNQPRGVQLIQDQNVAIPLLGFIAAGEPIEAISNPEPIKLPQSMLGKSGLYYGLKVKGNSMIDENINDGDTVIIKRQETAENGQKVVALINRYEATIKKIYKEKGGFRLQPANSSMKPIFVKNLELRGAVVGIIRKS